MDFNIQLAGKNAAEGESKTWMVALAGVIVGGVLAFLFGIFRDWLGRRREVKNVRCMIYNELKLVLESYKASENAERDEKEGQRLGFLLGYMTQHPVYDACIGQIGKLKEKEITSIISTYFWIELIRVDSLSTREKALRMEALTDGEISFLREGIQNIRRETTETLKSMKISQRKKACPNSQSKNDE